MNLKRIKTADFWITQKSRIQKGMAEFNFFRYIATFYLVLAGMDYFKGYHFSNRFYVLFGIIAVFGCWLIGYIWDKLRLFDIEYEFGNKRNPTMRYIKSKSRERFNRK